MKQLIYVIWMFLSGWIPATVFAQNADKILAESAKMYAQSNGIQAHFSLHTTIPQQGISESFKGIIYMRDDKFKLETPDMTTWYDGTTQWTYMPRTEEVNVTTPSGNELQVTNPAVLLRSYQNGFKAKYIGTSTTRQAKTAYDIELTPKRKSDIQSVALQVEKLTHVPASFTITDKNGATYAIVISEWETQTNQPDSFFSFQESDYPDAEIVDLR